METVADWLQEPGPDERPLRRATPSAPRQFTPAGRRHRGIRAREVPRIVHREGRDNLVGAPAEAANSGPAPAAAPRPTRSNLRPSGSQPSLQPRRPAHLTPAAAPSGPRDHPRWAPHHGGRHGRPRGARCRSGPRGLLRLRHRVPHRADLCPRPGADPDRLGRQGGAGRPARRRPGPAGACSTGRASQWRTRRRRTSTC